MKKQLLAAFALLTAATAAQAQITLTAATHMPQVGRGYYMAFVDTSANPTMPATGASQTWNYAGVNPIGFDTLDYFNCNAQTNCSSFGNANLVSGSPTDTFYQYFKTSASVFQTTGGSSSQFTAKLSNALDLYRYPFTYNMQFTDAGSGTATTPLLAGTTLSITAKDTVVGTGYGDITTPAGTFQNVLQVRNTTHTEATFLFQTVATIDVVSYEWYADTSRFPVMTLVYNTTDFNSQTTSTVSGTYRIPTPSAVSTVSAEETFSLVPNPSTGTTRVEIPLSFNTREGSISITDLTGKTVFIQSLNGATSVQVSTEGWSKGLYLVRLQNAEGRMLMNKLSVQ